MKNSVLVFISAIVFSFSCSSSKGITNIEPKFGSIEIPAKGELSVWKGVEHASFSVVLTNDNEKQSVELYTVKSSGSEKWINPSLLAKSDLKVRIPEDGHLFIKNFNPNPVSIKFQVNN